MDAFIVRRGGAGSAPSDRKVLFKNGINYSEDVCGGWVALPKQRGADPAASVQTAPTIVSTPSLLTFTINTVSGSLTSGLAHSFEPLDFTGASELIVTGDYSVGASASGYRAVRLDALVLDEYDSYFDNALAAECFFSNVGQGYPVAGPFSIAIDVAAITGLHRVGFGILVQHLGMTINVSALEIF